MALRGNFSGPVNATSLVKVSKDTASLVACTRKKFLVGGYGFFVSDIISGGLLGHLDPLYLALDANRLETRLQSESSDALDDLLGFKFKNFDLK